MSSAKCQACEKNFNEEQRKPRQMDCGCILCEKCIKGIYNLHSKFTCNKDNITTQRAIETLPILNLVSQQVQNPRPQEFCQIHQWQLLGLYCPLDKVRICVQCQQESHQGHGCITEQEAIQRLKTYLESTFRSIKQRLGNYESTLDQGYRQLSKWQISRVERMVQVQQQVKQNIKQACQKLVKDQQCQIKNQIKILKDTSDYYQQIGSQINAISNGFQENIAQVEEKRNQLDKLDVAIQEQFQSILQSSSEVYQDNQSEQVLCTDVIVDLIQHLQSSTVYQSYMSQVSQIKHLQLAMKRLSKDFQEQFRQQERKEKEYLDQIFYLEQQVSNYQSQANSFSQQVMHQNKTKQDLENQLVQVKQESVQVIQQKTYEYQIQLKNKDDQMQTSQSQYVKEIQELQQKMVNLQKDLAVSQQFCSQLQGQQQKLVQENFSYQEQMRILLNEQESLKSILKQLEVNNKTSSDQPKLQESQLKEQTNSLEYKTQEQQLKDFGWNEIVQEPIFKYVITKRVVPPRISVYRRIFNGTNKVQSYQLDNVGKVCSYRSVSEMTPIYGN